MTAPFGTIGDPIAPPTKFAAVTKSDSTDLTTIATKGLYVGTTGDVAVMGVGDAAAVTFKNVPAGSFIPGSFSRVMSTGTGASNIVAIGG